MAIGFPPPPRTGALEEELGFGRTDGERLTPTIPARSPKEQRESVLESDLGVIARAKVTADRINRCITT